MSYQKTKLSINLDCIEKTYRSGVIQSLETIQFMVSLWRWKLEQRPQLLNFFHLWQLLQGVASFHSYHALSPALTSVTSCCQLWQLVQDVASFASTWRLIPKSTDQLYALPINCIGVDFIIQVCYAATEKRTKIQFFPVMLHGGQNWTLHSFGRMSLKIT